MTILIKNRFNNLSMDNLIINDYNKNLITYLKDYKKNIEEKINNYENIILTGSVGSGKTFIMRSFFNDIQKIKIKRQKSFYYNQIEEEDYISSMYVNMYDLINELRKEYKGEHVDSLLFTCDLLFIDEIGIQFCTDAERQILFKLINYRYENFKPIFLISNHPLRSTNEIKGLYYILGDRIMDRICDCNCKVFCFNNIESMRKKCLK